MTGYQPEAAAAALHEVRQRRGQVSPLPPDIAPRTEADGAAVQRALAHRTGADSPGGFKIGATARRMQEYLGLNGPAAGFMAVGNIHRSGATVRFADYIRPGVECELAVRLARDLPPGPCTADQAADAVGDLVAGIEIVENRYGELLELGVPTLIADQVFHAAAVLGEPGMQDWRSLDIGTLRGRLLVDGSPARRRCRRRSDGPSDELPRLARRFVRGRRVRRAEGRAGGHARQCDAAGLADWPGQRDRRFFTAAAGTGATGMRPRVRRSTKDLRQA